MAYAISILNFIIGIIQVILGIRFILRLFGANLDVPIVAWIMSVSHSFLAPFAGIFPSFPLGGGSVLEIATLSAMIAYSILRYFLALLIRSLIPPPTPLA